ncbi:MAG: hypothetical protein ACFFBP_05985 [Promethearchaeota archaeon]
MSKKVVALAIFLAAFGGIMISGGFIVNNIIRDLTYGSIDEGLLGIKEQGIPIVEESLYQIGPASALAIIKEQGAAASAPLANGTIWMGHVLTVEKLSMYDPLPVLPALPIQSQYFDEVAVPLFGGGAEFNFSEGASLLGYPPIKGVSEWYRSDLNFTKGFETLDFTGLNNLKYGVNTTEMWWGKRLPGIYEDTYRRVGDAEWPPKNPKYNFSVSVATVDLNQDRGFGVMEILKLIESANKSQLEEMAGLNGYNLTNPTDNFTYNGEEYNKLRILYFYLTEYFFIEAISMIVADFNDETSTLYDEFPQYQPRDWNGNDFSYDDILLYSIIEQWAKCISYDEGADLHDSEPKIPVGTYGLEPGGPGKDSGIPMEAALQLWNETNEYSIANFPTGIEKWYNAYFDTETYNELLNEFSQYPGFDYENDTYGTFGWGFNETDMDLILDWLWGNGGGWGSGSFSEYLLPILIEANYDKKIEEFSFQILLEQWANGTIMGRGLYPGGFPLPLGFMEIYGFEIGYQGPGKNIIPTNMSLASALALWDSSSDFSLVTKNGLQKWFDAIGGDTNAYEALKTTNDLTDAAMNLIMNWIPNFQQNVMPYLAQYQMGLPTDSISLGNIIQVAGIGMGATCIGLAALTITGNIVAKRKRIA